MKTPMKVSKKEYAFLTLPWRLLDALADGRPLRPFSTSYKFVTSCEVWQLRLLYLFAWPVYLAAIVLAPVLLSVAAPIFLVLYLFVLLSERLEGYFARKREKSCTKVEWK